MTKWRVLGKRLGGGSPLVVLSPRAQRGHFWVTGGTGSGKTFGLLHRLLARLTEDPTCGSIVLSPKGEAASLALELFRGLGRRNIIVFAPFRNMHVPLNPLHPRDLHPAEQSRALVGVLAVLLADRFGARMESLCFFACFGVICARGTLLDVVRLLRGDEATLRWVLRHTSDAEVREYLMRLDRQPAASREAIATRVEQLLFGPLRASLCADSHLSDSELTSSQFVIDLSGAPLAAISETRFGATLAFNAVTAAIFSKPAGAPPTVFLVDECQVVARAVQDSLERVLSMARAHNCAIWAATQGLSTFARASAMAAESFLTNASVRIALKPQPEDLRPYRALYPRISMIDPERPDRRLSPAAVHEAFERRLASLGHRQGVVVADGQLSVFETLDTPMAALRGRARQLGMEDYPSKSLLDADATIARLNRRRKAMMGTTQPSSRASGLGPRKKSVKPKLVLP